MIVIGGFRSMYGTFFGVFLVYAIPDIVIKPLIGDMGGLSYIFSGVLIILVILFYPNGLKAVGGDLMKLINKLIKKDKSKVGGKE
jgi:branched-chain amino acid transport system permease protein